FRIAIKGPIAVPSGSNIRSVGQTLTQRLDLYVCLRPVKYFPGTPSPVKRPQDVNMTIFRENTEDIYAGMEFEAGKPETNKLLELLEEYNLLQKIRFPETTSFGLKPVSKESVQRLVRAAINFATRTKAPTVTFVHTGNILKYTEGNFIKWGYELAKKEFYNETITFQDCGGNPPHGKILIKDVAADIFIQHTFIKPVEYNVLVTLNLNGDYISNALTAQIGFTGISPSANINYDRGYAIFEPTHGTAPKYAGLDKVNPSSVILSGAMMFQYMGWNEAARIIENAFEKSISQKVVTYDFARIMDGAREVKCSEFANTMIKNM
ncbi:MAG: isocitrate/isopropylmalate family dehydrogenase, partial [Spirochaetia bacterium]|nr:isocitrate/isopropylmalate family dehydrogenase [Spirochaetia bacterium]